MYLTATRPYILYAVSLLSRYMHCASEIHFQAAKRVIRYVKGTANFGIMFKKTSDFQFLGFSDSDWAGSSNDMRSNGMFSWCSKKQDIVTQSTAEAEYIKAASAVNQALWIQKLLTDLYIEQKKSTEIFVDNQAAISIANNLVSHEMTKHFKIKLYFLREVQKNGDIDLVHCKTVFQTADILTKALPRARFEFLRKRLGIAALESRRSVESGASKPGD